MTLQDLQKQSPKLPPSDRWQLVQALLESLKPKTRPSSIKGNLSGLRGIAKSPVAVSDYWTEQDQTDIVDFSLHHAASLFSDEEAV